MDTELLATVSPPPAKSHDGHRDRLRGRFLDAGASALADYEMLDPLER